MSGRCREGHGVEGVGVLRPPVNQDELGLVDSPAQAAELTKTVDRDEKPLHRWHLDVEAPLVNVLVK